MSLLRKIVAMLPIELLLFVVLIITATLSAAYNLNLLDQIVHGELYSYGLQFNLVWANHYWATLRIIQILLGLVAVFTMVSGALIYIKYIRVPSAKGLAQTEKAEAIQSTSIASREPEPEPKAEPEQDPALSPSRLISCVHCGRTLIQPLRMLDFHGDRPRVVRICPFCNEVIPPVLRHADKEHRKKIFSWRRNTREQETVTPTQAE